ncbi:MAG: hypothetical protein P9L88_05930 [Candidatus Tantalella remota]|nr:hypothetical protein [Candidatus Tantalella remota]
MKNILALGVDNKTSFSVMSDKGLYVSDPVGDLTDIKNYNDFEKAISEQISGSSFAPELVVCDMHPDYRSARLADAIREKHGNSEIVRVQHHHAHITSCMLDNDINEQVIGISFDGTGYGTDGASWGGEFLICTRKDFQRAYHLAYVSQPGADKAAREGWRMAVSYLYHVFGKEGMGLYDPIFDRIGREKSDIIIQMIEKDINCPRTSSMGRLFDAVSSLAGICDESTFEAEAAILLEKKIKKGIRAFYEYDVSDNEIVIKRMIRGIMKDLLNGEDKGVIAAKFHNTIGEIIFKVSGMIFEDTGINKVLISGGCFQNRYLVDYLEKRFESSELELYKHKDFPATDLGISIGQAVVAAASR